MNIKSVRKYLSLHALPSLKADSQDWLHLDALRIVASLGIVWHHSHEFLYPKAARSALEGATMGYALFVDLFFVMSGFIISALYAERVGSLRMYGRFIQRRIGRLIPLFWLIFLLQLGMWQTILARHLPVATGMPDMQPLCLINNAFLFNGFVKCGTGQAVVGVSWSISIEFALYMIFPILIWLIKRMAISIIYLTFIFGYYLYNSAHAHGDINLFPQYSRGITSFTLGILFFQYRCFLTKLKIPSYAVVTLLIVSVMCMAFGAALMVTMAAVWITAAMAISADSNHNYSSVIRRIAPFGQLTYSIYMWHPIFILIILNAIGDKYIKASFWLNIALIFMTYLFVIITSYLSLCFFEHPMRRKIDGIKIF